MSQPVVEPGPSNIRINGPKQFLGGHLVTKAEAKEAAKSDRFIQDLYDYIAQEEAYMASVQREIGVIMQGVRKLRAKIMRAKQRKANRRQQIKVATANLRKRMAFEKIKKLREELNLT